MLLAFASALIALCVGCSTSTSISDPNIRTPGTKKDDEIIERLVGREVNKIVRYRKSGIVNVTCHNGLLLLTGYVISDALKQSVTEIAQRTPEVRLVKNYLAIHPARTLGQVTSDVLGNTELANRVRFKLQSIEEVDLKRMRVVVYAGLVYLMGSVTREQGQIAAETVSNLRGIRRVTKIFDYID